MGWLHKEKETKGEMARCQSQVLLPQLWTGWPLVPLTMGTGEGGPCDMVRTVPRATAQSQSWGGHACAEGSLSPWVEKNINYNIYMLFVICLSPPFLGF